MRRRNALLFVISVVSLTTPLPVLAEAGSKGSDKVPACELGKLFWRTDFVRFEIILGRITARNACHGKARIATLGDLDSGSGEVLTLRVMEGAPRIRYELCVDGERVMLSANDVDRLLIERRKEDGATIVRYVQEPNAEVKLTVQHGDAAKTYSAPSLWHLWLRHREVCIEHLQPCLAVLRPNWRIDDTIKKLEQRLFSFSGSQFLPGDEGLIEPNYAAWLKSMSDDRFAVRQAAFERFKKAGIAAKPFLESLDSRTLDGEQRMRIRQLRKSLVFQTEDSVNRICAWLRDDRWIWFAFLNDQHPAKRRMAYSHLKRICGDSLTYDPEAEADLRASQITVLEGRVFP